MKAVFLVSLLLVTSGCELLQEKTKSKVGQSQTPIRRFELTKNPDVAFDTQTGQLCRTWAWKPSGPEPKPDEDGTFPQRSTGEFTPTCISLYEAYPTSGN
jgi:hypothetical protein